MSLSLRSLLIVGAALASVAIAQVDPDLTGTWTTKSWKVLTGPVVPHSPMLRLRNKCVAHFLEKASTAADLHR